MGWGRKAVDHDMIVVVDDREVRSTVESMVHQEPDPTKREAVQRGWGDGATAALAGLRHDIYAPSAGPVEYIQDFLEQHGQIRVDALPEQGLVWRLGRSGIGDIEVNPARLSAGEKAALDGWYANAHGSDGAEVTDTVKLKALLRARPSIDPADQQGWETLRALCAVGLISQDVLDFAAHLRGEEVSDRALSKAHVHYNGHLTLGTIALVSLLRALGATVSVNGSKDSGSWVVGRIVNLMLEDVASGGATRRPWSRFYDVDPGSFTPESVMAAQEKRALVIEALAADVEGRIFIPDKGGFLLGAVRDPQAFTASLGGLRLEGALASFGLTPGEAQARIRAMLLEGRARLIVHNTSDAHAFAAEARGAGAREARDSGAAPRPSADRREAVVEAPQVTSVDVNQSPLKTLEAELITQEYALSAVRSLELHWQARAADVPMFVVGWGRMGSAATRSIDHIVEASARQAGLLAKDLAPLLPMLCQASGLPALERGQLLMRLQAQLSSPGAPEAERVARTLVMLQRAKTTIVDPDLRKLAAARSLGYQVLLLSKDPARVAEAHRAGVPARLTSARPSEPLPPRAFVLVATPGPEPGIDDDSVHHLAQHLMVSVLSSGTAVAVTPAAPPRLLQRWVGGLGVNPAGLRDQPDQMLQLAGGTHGASAMWLLSGGNRLTQRDYFPEKHALFTHLGLVVTGALTAARAKEPGVHAPDPRWVKFFTDRSHRLAPAQLDPSYAVATTKVVMEIPARIGKRRLIIDRARMPATFSELSTELAQDFATGFLPSALVPRGPARTGRVRPPPI
ncbi:MAG: hypothetical protein IT384_34165 [Deltaproteobacteria bacterium]|nr:hypothetical protein [Deltaproteobacteria bacterium]